MDISETNEGIEVKTSSYRLLLERVSGFAVRQVEIFGPGRLDRFDPPALPASNGEGTSLGRLQGLPGRGVVLEVIERDGEIELGVVGLGGQPGRFRERRRRSRIVETLDPAFSTELGQGGGLRMRSASAFDLGQCGFTTRLGGALTQVVFEPSAIRVGFTQSRNCSAQHQHDQRTRRQAPRTVRGGHVQPRTDAGHPAR